MFGDIRVHNATSTVSINGSAWNGESSAVTQGAMQHSVQRQRATIWQIDKSFPLFVIVVLVRTDDIAVPKIRSNKIDIATVCVIR